MTARPADLCPQCAVSCPIVPTAARRWSLRTMADMRVADPLADVLRLSQVHGAVMARVVAGERWGISIGQINGVAMHAVTSGSCWLRVGADPPRQLFRGDVVFLPHGTAHVVASAPRGRTEAFDRIMKERMTS